MLGATTPHKAKGDKASLKSFRSPKAAFGLVTPARPAAPTTTDADIILSKSGFQWGKSDTNLAASANVTKPTKYESQEILRAQQTHARSVSSSHSLSSSRSSEVNEPPANMITEANPVSGTSASAVVESTHDTPSIISSQMTGPSDSSTHNISLGGTEATSLLPTDSVSDIGAAKTRSRSPSIDSVPGSDNRSHSPSIASLPRSSASPSPLDASHGPASSWEHAGLDSSEDQLPETQSPPAVVVTGSSSATPLPRFSPSPEPVSFMPTMTKHITSEPPPIGFPSTLPVPDDDASDAPDPRSPLTYRPRRSFSQRGTSDFGLRKERQAGSNAARIRSQVHRRAFSQDSPKTADGNGRMLNWIPEVPHATHKPENDIPPFVPPPPITHVDPTPLKDEIATLPPLPASPKLENVGETFGPLRCPSPEHAEARNEAEKRIDEILRTDEPIQPPSGPEPLVAPVSPPSAVVPLDNVKDECLVQPVAVVPVVPSVADKIETVKIETVSDTPTPKSVSRSMDKQPESVFDKPSFGQAAIYPAVGGVLGGVYRAGSTWPHQDTSQPPVVVREQQTREREQTKPLESHTRSKAKHTSIMDLDEIATFRGQLSIVFSWMENRTLPSVNTSAGLAYLYLTDQSPGLNVSLSKSRGAKRTAFENIVTKTYTVEFTGATHSILRSASILLVAFLTTTTYAYMWGWL